MKLALGVIDIPYNGKGSTSTGDVATFLENKYSVMGNFVELHLPEIAEVFAVGVHEAIDSILQGAPRSIDPFKQANDDVKMMFTNYINNEEITATGQAGVPTEAAEKGVRTSLKKKKEIKNIGKYRSKVRGTRRSSFVDTGLYRDNFKSWIIE